MNEPILTKNAEVMLRKLYAKYRRRIREGMPKSDASDFGGSMRIHADLFPQWTLQEVDSACEELLNAGLISGFRADSCVYQTILSDTGISLSHGAAPKSVARFFGRVLECLQAIRFLLP